MKLHAFQEKAVEWLLPKKRAYLAAKMGLGKSAIALRTIQSAKAFPCLIVCPKIVKAHWAKEVSQWLDLENQKHVDIVSYEAAKAVKGAYAPKYTSAIFDEAHYLKNHSAMRTKKLVLDKKSIASQIERVYFLSGTPTPNNVSELWPALYFMGAIKERYIQFTNRYCEFQRLWIPKNGSSYSITKITGNMRARMPELKRRTKDFLLQISYSEARIELPAVKFTTYPVFAKRAQDHEFESAALKALKSIGGDEFTALLALAPSLSTVRRLHAERKILPAAELIRDEIYFGLYEKIIVFAHHQNVIEGLHNELTRLNVKSVFVHGGVEQEARFNRIEEFQTDKEVQVYIGSIVASGTGVNLYAANQVLFIEQSFVPGENAQAIARSARIGQNEKTVHARWLVLEDSAVDNRVSEILLKKTEDIAEFEK